MSTTSDLVKLANDVDLLASKVGASARAVVESYGWGKLRKVELGNEIKAIIHPEDWEQISTISDGGSTGYTDEQGIKWTVTRDGDDLTFKPKGIRSNKSLTVPFKDLDR